MLGKFCCKLATSRCQPAAAGTQTNAMGLADVAFSMYRNGFTAYLGGNPLSLGFLIDRRDPPPVAAAMAGSIDTRMCVNWRME
jgi:hypothetical protein